MNLLGLPQELQELIFERVFAYSSSDSLDHIRRTQHSLREIRTTCSLISNVSLKSCARLASKGIETPFSILSIGFSFADVQRFHEISQNEDYKGVVQQIMLKIREDDVKFIVSGWRRRVEYDSGTDWNGNPIAESDIPKFSEEAIREHLPRDEEGFHPVAGILDRINRFSGDEENISQASDIFCANPPFLNDFKAEREHLIDRWKAEHLDPEDLRTARYRLATGLNEARNDGVGESETTDDLIDMAINSNVSADDLQDHKLRLVCTHAHCVLLEKLRDKKAGRIQRCWLYAVSESNIGTYAMGMCKETVKAFQDAVAALSNFRKLQVNIGPLPQYAYINETAGPALSWMLSTSSAFMRTITHLSVDGWVLMMERDFFSNIRHSTNSLKRLEIKFRQNEAEIDGYAHICLNQPYWLQPIQLGLVSDRTTLDELVLVSERERIGDRVLCLRPGSGNTFSQAVAHFLKTDPPPKCLRLRSVIVEPQVLTDFFERSKGGLEIVDFDDVMLHDESLARRTTFDLQGRYWNDEEDVATRASRLARYWFNVLETMRTCGRIQAASIVNLDESSARTPNPMNDSMAIWDAPLTPEVAQLQASFEWDEKGRRNFGSYVVSTGLDDVEASLAELAM